MGLDPKTVQPISSIHSSSAIEHTSGSSSGVGCEMWHHLSSSSKLTSMLQCTGVDVWDKASLEQDVTIYSVQLSVMSKHNTSCIFFLKCIKMQWLNILSSIVHIALSCCFYAFTSNYRSFLPQPTLIILEYNSDIPTLRSPNGLKFAKCSNQPYCLILGHCHPNSEWRKSQLWVSVGIQKLNAAMVFDIKHVNYLKKKSLTKMGHSGTSHGFLNSVSSLPWHLLQTLSKH